VNELEIVYLDPHDLTPYENNTRKHTPEDIEQIKESIAADTSQTRLAFGAKRT